MDGSFSMISDLVHEHVIAEQRKMLMRSMMAKRTPNAMHNHSSHSSVTPAPKPVEQYTTEAKKKLSLIHI